MGMDMIYPNKWYAQRPRQGLGGGDADQQAADKSWAVGDGDGVDLGKGDPRLGERFGDNRQNIFNVSAAGDFRDHATITRVDFHLACDNIAANGDAVLDDGSAGFIAGGFNSEDQHFAAGSWAVHQEF
jgi:hypothetical protein